MELLEFPLNLLISGFCWFKKHIILYKIEYTMNLLTNNKKQFLYSNKPVFYPIKRFNYFFVVKNDHNYEHTL